MVALIMQWASFTHNEKRYCLEHLDSHAVQIVITAKGDKPAQIYRLNVDYSLHCFTRGAKAEEAIPNDLAYADSREVRIFDFERYELSKRLPVIIADLAERKCFHDHHGNFYVVELVDAEGRTRYYSIFFKLSKAGKRQGLNLFVSSAHARSELPYAKSQKPIRFRVLVYNVHRGKEAHAAP